MAGYVNPIGAGLKPGRVDMGVDYTGAGNLYALGAGKIVNVYNAGWPSGIFIGLKLDGSSNLYVYYAENIVPQVKVGQQVNAGQLVGTAVGVYPYVEIGWAAAPGTGETMAASTGQDAAGLRAGDPGKYPTAFGVSMSNLIKSLGGPAGIIGGAVQGTVPKTFPGLSGAITPNAPGPGQASPQQQAAAGIGAIAGASFAFILLGLVLVPGMFMLYRAIARLKEIQLQCESISHNRQCRSVASSFPTFGSPSYHRSSEQAERHAMPGRQFCEPRSYRQCSTSKATSRAYSFNLTPIGGQQDEHQPRLYSSARKTGQASHISQLSCQTLRPPLRQPLRVGDSWARHTTLSPVSTLPILGRKVQVDSRQ